MATQNITLDGLNGFSAFGSTSIWSNLTINRLSIGIDPGEDPNEGNALNASFAGGAWRIRDLNLYNDIAFDFDVTLTDANDGVFRRIERLNVSGSGDTAITLFNTRVRYLEVNDDRTLTLTLGTELLNYFRSDGRLNAITLGSGDVTSMRLGVEERASVNTVTGGTGYIGQLEFGEGSTNTVNIGAYFGSIRTFGVTNNFTFNDGGESLVLARGVSTVNLNGSFYASITGFEGTNTINVGTQAEVRNIGLSSGNDRLTLAANARVETAVLGSGNNVVTLGANSFIEALVTYSGNDRLTLNGGEIVSAGLGSGTNVITVNAGRIDSLITFQGNDVVTITGGRVDSMNLGSGNNRIQTGTEFVSQIQTYEGNDQVTIGAGGAGNVKLNDGNNTLTATGHIETLQVFDGNDTVTLGAQGANYVELGDGTNVLTTGTGFVDFIISGDGVDRITIGSGGALAVRTNAGNDIVNITAGRVDYLETADGNDTVTLGNQLARMVVLGDGDDTLFVSRSTVNFGVEVQGGAGTDTVDLTAFATGVTVSLDTSAFQQPAGALNLGYLAMIQVENLTGTAFTDALTGSAEANVLSGGVGNDTLTGLAGADRLIGGRNNDRLSGGEGADVFVFAPNDGVDRIVDFVEGVDKIELLAANSLSDLTFTAVGTGVQIGYTGLRIIVENTTLVDLQDANNFLF